MSEANRLLETKDLEADASDSYSDCDAPSTPSRRSQLSLLHDLLAHRPKWADLPVSTSARLQRYVAALAGFLITTTLLLLVYTFYWMPLQLKTLAPIQVSDVNLVKPEGFKIVAIVFYGRPRFANVLDCYLKKNLVTQGGFLDEVIFADNTNHQEDEDWLDQLIETEPLYRKVIMSHRGGWYHDVWNNVAIDEETMYIKIDDDVVFVDDHAIPRMVYTLMSHPEAHDVAANIVNSPITNWLHYHTEAVLPYLPDEDEPKENATLLDWRASKLPRYAGSHSGKYEFKDRPDEGFEIGQEGGPPHQNHRWLPLANSAANLEITPITGAEYHAFGRGWNQWAIQAQQHYSFLERLEHDKLDMYWTGNKDGIWNMQFDRYNLNFLAIWGRSVNMMSVTGDDEGALTVDIPRALKRPCLVDTHAIISHFSFATTRELETTDLLERYRLYANEMVCTADNQRQALGNAYAIDAKFTVVGEEKTDDATDDAADSPSSEGAATEEEQSTQDEK